MKNFRNWLLPSVTLVCLTAFAVLSAMLYSHNLEQQQKSKSQQISEAIAHQLRSEIFNRISILRILAQQNVVPLNDKNYRSVASAIMSEFPDFYAINYIDSSGVIRKVHPVEENREALGRNLLNRSDVKNYLLESRLDRQPRMSHRLLTYQKVYAFTLYIPLYDEKKNFIGWLNALVDIDNWVRDYLSRRSGNNTLIKVNWKGSQTPGVSFGPEKVAETFEYSYSVMNQELTVQVGFNPNQADVDSSNSFRVIILFGIGLLLMVGYLIIKITSAHIKIKNNYAILSMKNTLLSSLSHDLSTPLMVLSLSLKKFMRGEAPEKVQIDRAVYALSSIEKMLKSARLMHAEDLGLSQIKSENVNLKLAVSESTKLLIEICSEKNMIIDISGVSEADFVKADSNTLINNVLLNVFSNIVRICKPGAKIKVSSAHEATYTKLFIEDEAKSSESLRSLFEKLTPVVADKKGVGEQGTGLGVLQARTLMQIYGGQIEYINLGDSRLQLILKFKTAQS